MQYLLAQENRETGTIHIGVVVSDLQKSVDFYTNVVGMKKTGSFTVDANFARRSGLSGGEPFEVTGMQLDDKPGATQYKLMSFGRKATHPPRKDIRDDTGIQYITIFVDDLQPYLDRIRKHHVRLLGDTPIPGGGPGNTFVLIRDPDGTFN